jgi:RimJ/RimL family protein N-acetyltransferase
VCEVIAFTAMNRDHIVSLIDPLNASSTRVAERLGERIERETMIGGYRFIVYGISRP